MSDDPVNFSVGRRWVWHGGVSTEDVAAGHWADEPCAECKKPATGSTMRVTKIDHETGTITYDVE